MWCGVLLTDFCVDVCLPDRRWARASVPLWCILLLAGVVSFTRLTPSKWYKDGVEQVRQFTCKVTQGHAFLTIVAVKNNKYYTLLVYMCVCVLAIVISHANSNFLRRVILSAVRYQFLPYFSTLSHKNKIVEIGYFMYNIFFIFFFTTLPETFLIRRRN